MNGDGVGGAVMGPKLLQRHYLQSDTCTLTVPR